MITIAVIILVVALVGVVIYLCLRKKHKRNETPKEHWCVEEQPQQSGEYDNYNVGGECPYCHSRDVAEYTYGYPMPKFIYDKNGNLVERKVPKPDRRVISRGCIIRDSSPLYHCYSCNRDWGRVLGAKRSRASLNDK